MSCKSCRCRCRCMDWCSASQTSPSLHSFSAPHQTHLIQLWFSRSLVETARSTRCFSDHPLKQQNIYWTDSSGWYEKHPVHLAVSNDLLNQGLIHYLPSGVRLQSKVHIILDHFALKIFAVLVLLASESRRSWITLYFLCLFSSCSGFSTALWKCSQYQFQK